MPSANMQSPLLKVTNISDIMYLFNVFITPNFCYFSEKFVKGQLNFNPSTWKAGYLWVTSEHGLYSECKASQALIVRPFRERKVVELLRIPPQAHHAHTSICSPAYILSHKCTSMSISHIYTLTQTWTYKNEINYHKFDFQQQQQQMFDFHKRFISGPHPFCGRD